jgi:hypothetical protein
MVLNLSRWFWSLLHRRTVFVAVKRVEHPALAAAQPAQRNDGSERLTAARFVH